MLDYRMDTFLTLCETMNYRKASERLNVTQPAVTQHVQYLERHYGCRLFSYDGRKLEITPEGELLRRNAQAMRYREKKLMESLKQNKGHKLAIGATKTIGEFLIADHVAAFLEREENQLHVNVDNTEKLLEQLDGGELDFALIEGYFDGSRYGSAIYDAADFVGVCGTTHPFAGSVISMERLWNEEVFLREEGSGTRKILESLLQENNRSLKDFRRSTCLVNFGLIERLLATGRGVTFAYEPVAANSQRLATFRVEGWQVRREFHYVFLPETEAEKNVTIFEEYRHK